MVASGLTGDAIYVQPTRLALHFVFALGLVVYAFWFALQLSVPNNTRLVPDRGDPGRVARLRHWTITILVVLFFQLLYGALMAGHKAATVAPTWPTINGDWMPDGVFKERPIGQDLVGNKITVQFIHRSLAYLLLVLVGVWTMLACRLPGKSAGTPGGPGAIFRRLRWLPSGLILVQVVLGIFSLLTSPGIVPNHWVAFDWLAQFHQVTGLVFLLTMVGMLYLVIPVRQA
jgi:cytochrome c oxidase assembly protein subunit 15